jgi:Domain of unknown function (DUF4412)
MKIFFKITSIAILLFSVTIFSSAQKTLKEGSVIYELTTIESDAPEAQMMKGSRMNLYFNKKKQKFEISMMGGMVEIISITDLTTEESTMLTNVMGNKSMVKMSKEETEKQKEKNQKPEFEVIFDKKDKKEIVGYSCYRATLKGEDGTVITTYVTDEIKTKLEFFNQMFPGLNVFPLEYSIDAGGISLVFAAQEFKTKVDSDTFNIPTEGYTEMTLEEFEKQMGGLGGMGF